MRRIRQFLLAIGMLAVAITNSPADTVITAAVTGINAVWGLVPGGAWKGGTSLAPACSSGGASQCGYFYTPTGSNGWNSLNGSYGWHGYGPTDPNWGNPQAFLNNLTSGTGLSIGLSGTASLNTGATTQYLNPTNDTGYFLSTANTSNAAGITMNFSSAIKDFSLYWGSVDSWNTITFTDTNNTPYTFSGSDLSNYSYWDPNGDNSMSVRVHFSVPSGYKPWNKISFSSCNSAGTLCQPAFEFDNIEWVVAPSGCCSPTGAGAVLPSPVPEPSSLPLLSTGVFALAGWLTRRARPRT